ncbi:CHAT domain-containing protein [Roridomyces roridus]|uniref:CHAT domain-containing protein n=1 Tax=Roridomyces roridus TaxID=1738132 RepID=A0AAD7FA90_9AGAR|nr:CHAT domain-containing protein [Roridomyces roridus]
MRGKLLNNVAIIYAQQWDLFHVPAALDGAVLAYEDAVREEHPYKPQWLPKLGTSLIERFENFGSRPDLDRSIAIREGALQLTPEYGSDRASALNDLGNSFSRRFELLGDLHDLEKAVQLREEAVALAEDGDPGKPGWLSTLGSALLNRYDQFGKVEDLNRCISVSEDAVRWTPDGDIDKPGWLDNLGSALRTRFGHFGDIDDLNKSIKLKQEAVRLTAQGNPARPGWLSSLGSSFLDRFQRTHNFDDLHKAVALAEEAVASTPDGHPNKLRWLSTLGGILGARYDILGDWDDLKRTILVREQALDLTPKDHPQRGSMLISLSGALLTRYTAAPDAFNLDNCIDYAEESIVLTPDGHPMKSQALFHAARACFGRIMQLNQSGQMIESLMKAIDYFAAAARAPTGPPVLRFEAARFWAMTSRMLTRNLDPLAPYRTALELLPELAWLGLSISDRHQRLSDAGSVVRDAAAQAIAIGSYETAVEWLEQGRSVIWGQLLNLRTPVDNLMEKHPSLAKRFLTLSAQLEGAGTRRTDFETQQSIKLITNKAHQNAVEREKLLKEIRELPEFERFLLPKTISELSTASQHGVIVMLNVNELQCDALALLPGLEDEVMHIPLPNFKPEDVDSLAKSLGGLVGRGVRLKGGPEGQKKNPEEEFRILLSKLWFGIVKPVLDGLGICSNLSRIWWCPTGPLVFLPIHAAGVYGAEETFGSKLSDYVISSYTPSLTALTEAFRTTSNTDKNFQLLAVSQPAADGQMYIPGTEVEIRHIVQLAKEKQINVVELDRETSTVEEVKQGMSTSRWVHFACHGVQNITEPTESALLLARNSRLTLSNIIELALPHADLAFLSACQTAMGDNKLPEEAVHLAAGMLLAGYKGVIATMWTITDHDAPQVARDVYEYLLDSSPPDPTKAAEALHVAIQKLRERSAQKSFFDWVPYIHVGV